MKINYQNSERAYFPDRKSIHKTLSNRSHCARALLGEHKTQRKLNWPKRWKFVFRFHKNCVYLMFIKHVYMI